LTTHPTIARTLSRKKNKKHKRKERRDRYSREDEKAQ